MRSTICLIFLCSFCLATTIGLSQSSYQDGYYINQSGNKLTGLILNEHWTNNPERISFKKSIDAEAQILEKEDISSFGFKGILYEKHTVDADLSSNELKDLRLSGNPEYEKHTLFLETLIRGELSLYGYTQKGQTKYFYSKGTETPKQLIYKLYNVNGSTLLIRKNKQYQQQLATLFGKDFMPNDKASKIDYRTAPLQAIFAKYLKSKNIEYRSFSKQTAKVYAGATVRVGIRNAKADFLFTNTFGGETDASFDKEQNITFSAEFEVFLNGRKKTTSVFIQPTVFSYSSEGLLVFFSGNTRNLMLEYSGLDISIGVKQRIYLNNNLSLNPKIGYTFFKGNSELIYGPNSDKNAGTEGGVLLALELSIRDKWNFQVGYETPRTLFGFNGIAGASYQYLSLSAGYRFW